MGRQKHCRAVQCVSANHVHWGIIWWDTEVNASHSITSLAMHESFQKLSKADEIALFEYLMAEGWRQQDEMVYWLWHERGALVSRSTVSRVLKYNKWTWKEIRRISMDRSENLRQAYLDDRHRFVAEDLIFLDESVFNEKTGWHTMKLCPCWRWSAIRCWYTMLIYGVEEPGVYVLPWLWMDGCLVLA